MIIAQSWSVWREPLYRDELAAAASPDNRVAGKSYEEFDFEEAHVAAEAFELAANTSAFRLNRLASGGGSDVRSKILLY